MSAPIRRHIDKHFSYWLKVILCLAFTTFAWVAGIPFLAVPTDTELHWSEIQHRKSEIAASIKGPRFLLVGASGTFYAIRADVLSHELRVPTVNLGLQAGFGLKYLLGRSKMDIRSGDTVLLTVEYGLLKSKPDYTAAALDYIFSVDRAYLGTLPLSERVSLPMGMSPVRTIGDDIKNPGRKRSRADSLRLVGRFGDGLYGKAPPTPQMTKAIRTPDVFDARGPDSDGLRAVGDYAAWCHRHGVRLILTYPAYAHLWDVDTAAAHAFMNRLQQAYVAIGVPVVGQPYEYVYDGSWFYDTRYHLKRQFSEISTIQRARELQVYFRPSGPVGGWATEQSGN